MASYSFFPTAESRELSDDVRALFEDLARSLDRDQLALTGECRPALDVRETDEAIEITVDVAGVPSTAIRVLFRGGIVLVVGQKVPAATTHDQTFHLVEREFGRFARAVKIAGAFDLARAAANVQDGELTIVLPKMAERRGRGHRIPVMPTGGGPS